MSTAKGSFLPDDTRYAAAEDYYLAFLRKKSLQQLRSVRPLRSFQPSAVEEVAVELTVVANTRSKRFYLPRDARYKRALRQVNLIVFADPREAAAAGYRPA